MAKRKGDEITTAAAKKERRAIEPKFAAIAQATNAAKTAHDYNLPTWSGLDPAQVGAILAAYEAGDYQFAVPFLEAVARYDAQISTCFQKRIAATASSEWEILIEANIDEADKPLAEKQAGALQDFFNALKVSSSFATDAAGGVSTLVEHILSAIGFGYSASALTLFPVDGGQCVSAKITTAPLRLFEARERRLRIRTNYGDTMGKEIDGGQWIIAHKDAPLMLPALVLFCLKSTPQEDWAHVVEKFGTPFVLLKTPAARGSQEWNEAVNAAPKIGSGFSAAVGSDVEVQTLALAQGNAPHAVLIDYLDRQISRLWLGGDLSTMSRSDAVGGLSQANDFEAILKGDAQFVEGVIDAQLTRRVLDVLFGKGSKQLAYFKFSTNVKEAVSDVAQKIQAAQSLGLEIPKAWAYSALGIPMPKDGEETTEAKETTKQEAPVIPFPLQEQEEEQEEQEEQANADFGNAAQAQAETLPASVKDAQRKEMKTPLDYLKRLEATETESEFFEVLVAFDEAFPQISRSILSRDDVAKALSKEISY